MPSTVTNLREIVQYAPPPGKIADGLLGWITPDGIQVCAACASRVFGRGCRLPNGSTAQWADSGLPIVCDVCQ